MTIWFAAMVRHLAARIVFLPWASSKQSLYISLQASGLDGARQQFHSILPYGLAEPRRSIGVLWPSTHH